MNSYFKSIKDWKLNPYKYRAMPKMPNYKHKTKGRNIIKFPIQNIVSYKLIKSKSSNKHIKSYFLDSEAPNTFNLYKVTLPKTNISFNTIVPKHLVNEIRILPYYDVFKVEIVYSLPKREPILQC